MLKFPILVLPFLKETVVVSLVIMTYTCSGILNILIHLLVFHIYFLEFTGKECKDSELVSHLMPGTESRTAVSPFACLSNITDQDLFDIDDLRNVCTLWCETFFILFLHSRLIIFITMYQISRKQNINTFT